MMKRIRSLSALFLLANMVLIGALAWGGKVFYNWQEQRIADDVTIQVKNTARKVQEENMILNNLAGLLNDSMKDEKLSFAAGMTGNMGKMRQWFDDDKEWQDEKIKKQNYEARINKRGQEVLTINRKFINDRDITFNAGAVKKIEFFDSLFKHTLDSTTTHIKYNIHRLTSLDTSYTTSYKYSSQGFIINFYDPKIYRVDYTIQPLQPLLATLPYAGMCMILLVLSFISYLLLMRSYKAQAQTALFRETLFSNITHELKTPISSLQIILGLAGKESPPTISKSHLDFASSELERMKQLTEKIIAFGRMNHEQLELNKTIVNADELIKEAIQATEMQAEQTGAKLQYESPHAKINLAGDRALLINTITTLIDNAIKYNKDSPLITINLEQKNTHVLIQVADNGIGIAPAYHKLIFDPFFRVPTGDIHNVKGHGLGLSFAAQVVKLHGGEILAASGEKGGSVFTIKLPTT